MFVLIKGENEVIDSHNEVMVFDDHAEAQAEMERQLRERMYESGMTWDEINESLEIGNDCYLGNDRAFVVDDCGWVIKHVPGVLISEDTANSYRHSINRAKARYSQSDMNTDYSDADDACKDVAYDLYDRLGYPTLKFMQDEARETDFYEFEESSVKFFNDEYAYRNPIVADNDDYLWWCTIGVPDDEHGYVVTILEVEGQWCCEFTQGEHTGMWQATGNTPKEAWESSRAKFLEEKCE